MVKELHYSIAHLSLNEFATMENDAKSCYDRMVPSLIMLISRSFGLSKNVCRTVGKTFQKTKHKVATRNGISMNSFGYTKEKPIFGSWQGATKSVVNFGYLPAPYYKRFTSKMPLEPCSNQPMEKPK